MGALTSFESVAMPAATTPLALAVADINWFTTENLFREVPSGRARTLLLKCIDYQNAWKRGLPPWKWGRELSRRNAESWERDLVLPPGWMKRLPRLGMRPIRQSIQRWRVEHAPDGPLALVMTYPHYLYLRDQVRPDRQIYYNVDDYSLYWPHHADEINRLERQLVREADLTVCVSRLRAEGLRLDVPEAADRIIHLPHGAPSAMLSPAPLDQPGPAPEALAGLPRPLLGYVGSLGERVDWALMSRLGRALPEASIVLLGKVDSSSTEGWRAERARCLALPNVHLIGWQPQDRIAAFNRAFDVCLIPYQTDDPFNRACCPTKISDYMATSRPIVSTALPECLLHRALFDVVGSTEEFIEAVARILSQGSDDGRARLRLEWARENSCGRIVERMLDQLV
jgi:teichuronic acid biosynthesis glycosyltransferase TuaH